MCVQTENNEKTVFAAGNFMEVIITIIIKLSSTCEEFKFRGWYDAAFRLSQETHPILFEFQQTR